MILTLFGFLVGISLILIVIGLAKSTESAQALVGFFFLFLLSLVVVNGNLEYRTGTNTTIINEYENTTLTNSTEIEVYNYNSFNDTTSHRIGVYLAIASAIGFAGVLYSIGRTNWREE